MIKKLFECVVQRTTFPNFDYLLQRLPKTLSQNLSNWGKHHLNYIGTSLIYVPQNNAQKYGYM